MTATAETRCTTSQVRRFVEVATRAASPDNNQPWRFVYSGGSIFVFEDRTRRLPSDVQCMFSLLALGSAIESLTIAASEQGLEAAVDMFPKGCDAACLDDRPVAAVRLIDGGTRDPLANHLETRATNRRPYAKTAIDPRVLDELCSAAKIYGGVDVHWLSTAKQRRAFARLVAVSDRLRFEYAPFHAELFKQLRFTAGDAQATRDGLDLRLLALPPGAGLVLRCLRSWPLVSTLNRIGLSRALAMPAARLVVRSAAIGLVTVDSATPQTFVNGGRAFQRLWLTAEAAGLALHPLGSLPVFLAQGDEGIGDRGQGTASRGQGTGDRGQAGGERREAPAAKEAGRNVRSTEGMADRTAASTGRAETRASGGPDIPVRLLQNPKSKIQNRPVRCRASQLDRLVVDYQCLVPAASGRTLLIAFRLGYAKPPSIRSLRRHVEEVLNLNE